MPKPALSLLVFLCGLAPAPGALLAAETPTLALVGGQVIDGYEGPPIHDGVVLIAGERILAVGRRGEVTVPGGTPVIDTAGMSVLPGLMDMHVHLMLLGHSDYEHWDTTYMSRFGDLIMPIAAKQLLESGVTTVRDLGAPLEEILHVRRRIEKGEIPGPRLFVSGPFIQHRPYFEYERFVRWGIDGPEDARAKVQRLVDAGVDFIKLIEIAGATRWPARFLKKERELGTLAPGRYADVIAVKGDVLANVALLQRVDVVVKNGARVR